MSDSITIVIPNRNRDLKTVQRSLDSIDKQSVSAVKIVVVDYGSKISYQQELQQLIYSFSHIELILCPTQGQLWNKSRCINIVLKTCATSHFMVCDMDMIWHPAFLKKTMDTLSVNESVYYTVGIMTQEESAIYKTFEEYAVKFQTGHEATGITIFPTEHLKSINGFDEFYHGWGSEDTDVHVRLRNAGLVVRFRKSEVYFKHQWHAKAYRSKESNLPFHAHLERINQKYLLLNKKTKKIKENSNKNRGQPFELADYRELNKPTQHMNLTATEEEILAFVNYLNGLDTSVVIQVRVTKNRLSQSLKTQVKRVLGKKTPRFMTMERANEVLLEAIILNHHYRPHHYRYDRVKKEIILMINRKVNL
jgi:glycosyltransferase involved in cell wall biosynthesis